jgi:hypothetical protein
MHRHDGLGLWSKAASILLGSGRRLKIDYQQIHAWHDCPKWRSRAKK